MADQSSSGGQLQGKVAIVTGGASGIGEGICMEFTRQGAALVVMDIDGPGGTKVAKAIEHLGGEAIASETDITDDEGVKAEVEKTLRQLGTVDILVNCAGWNHFVPPDAYSMELWRKIRSVNLDGMWNTCHAVMPEMMRKRSGKIINIGSAAAVRAIPQAASYSIAKHGVVGLTRAFAVDLGAFNINVNCICPATIETPLLMEATNPAFKEGMLRSIPMGRLGKLSDVAKAALFLASPDSSWITGVVLPVDGGLTACIRAHHFE